MAAQNTRIQITDNKKRIKKIEKNIRKDKNEDMYGLESFDSDINALHDDIARIEEEKSSALEEFEKKVKETHGSNKHAKQYLKAAEAARVMLSED